MRIQSFSYPLLALLTSSLTGIAQSAGTAKLPDTFEIIRDIAYAETDNPRQMLDLFLPGKKHKGPLPVIIFIHGGGWRNGDKRSGLKRVQPFLESGQYAAASVGYRLSGEAKWPAQIHDCKAAIRWIRKNGKNYGLNTDKMAVWGTSAGGHLVAMLGTSGDVDSMDGRTGPYPEVSSRVTCVADFFGPTDFLLMNKTAIPGASLDHDSVDSPESLLIGAPIQENPELVKTINPITYVSKDDPPFLIVHGTQDPLVSFNQSELLRAALNKAGVDNTLITVKGGGHGKGFGKDVNELLTRFFDHHLRDKKTNWKDETVRAVGNTSR